MRFIHLRSDNAELLSTICIDNILFVINNLKYQDKQFSRGKTFLRRDRWVSEVDTCIVSAEILGLIENFVVLERSDLPSDHAPVLPVEVSILATCWPEQVFWENIPLFMVVPAKTDCVKTLSSSIV